MQALITSLVTGVLELCSLITALVKMSMKRLVHLMVSLFLVLATMTCTSQSVETGCRAHSSTFTFALFIIHYTIQIVDYQTAQ
jgi:choline-glycine betaine transporter